MNPNDVTAKYYDIVYKGVKGTEITQEELKLIKSLVLKKDKILDVGCGSGRHLVPLTKLGYDVTGIDSSRGMLNVLKNKISKKSEILHQDFFKITKKNKYNLIILMWNVFNEIATSKNDARRLISKLKSLTAKDGKILINIDNPNKLNLPNISSTLVVSEKTKKYKSDWTVKKFSRQTNTTISEEHIRVFKGNKLIYNKKALIKQRWWSFNEIKTLAKIFKLKVKTKRLKSNKELYIILEK